MRKDLYNRLNEKLVDSNMISSLIVEEEEQQLKIQKLRELEKQRELNQQNVALEEPIVYENPTIIQAIVSDSGKLGMVLFFGVSIFALYVILKSNNKK